MVGLRLPADFAGEPRQTPRGVGDGSGGLTFTDRTSQPARLIEAGGTVIIDGGNTHYRDDIRHAEELSGKGIPNVDGGRSGRRMGSRARLMPDEWRRTGGGCSGSADVRSMAPGLEERPRTSGREVAPARPSRATLQGRSKRARVHFVKMVHHGHRVRDHGPATRGHEHPQQRPDAQAPATEADARPPRGETSASKFITSYDIDTRQVAEVVCARGGASSDMRFDMTAEALLAFAERSRSSPARYTTGEGRWTSTRRNREGVPAPVLTRAVIAVQLARVDDFANERCRPCARVRPSGHEEKGSYRLATRADGGPRRGRSAGQVAGVLDQTENGAPGIAATSCGAALDGNPAVLSAPVHGVVPALNRSVQTAFHSWCTRWSACAI